MSRIRPLVPGGSISVFQKIHQEVHSQQGFYLFSTYHIVILVDHARTLLRTTRDVKRTFGRSKESIKTRLWSCLTTALLNADSIARRLKYLMVREWSSFAAISQPVAKAAKFQGQWGGDDPHLPSSKSRPFSVISSSAHWGCAEPTPNHFSYVANISRTAVEARICLNEPGGATEFD